jgi:Protein kinase domain
VRRAWLHLLAQMQKLPLTDGAWRYSRRPRSDEPAQGWKIHVSATVLSAADVLSRVRPILRKHDLFFKIPANPELLASLNAGLPDFAQVGKFLTVYPRSATEATRLARELHLATRGLTGPRIPFDARYRGDSLVHYRYGAFRSSPKNRFGSVRDQKGKLRPDKRGPGLAVPDWVDNPFQKIQPKSSAPTGPIGIQLLAYKVKMQRGKGGVYEALDLSVSPPRRVILKEGRRHGETDWFGRDGYARLKHEGRVLQSLRKAGLPVPLVFREFTQNGNRYLVLERIAGRPLIAPARDQPRQFSWPRAEKILKQVEPVLSRLHAAGWVWRDCKPSHIFVCRGQVRLIDFEEAGRIGGQNLLPWRSKHYCQPNNQRSRISVRDDDYALGVIAFQFGTGKFPPAPARARASLFQRTKCPSALREKIERLLTAKIPRRLVK